MGVSSPKDIEDAVKDAYHKYVKEEAPRRRAVRKRQPASTGASNAGAASVALADYEPEDEDDYFDGSGVGKSGTPVGGAGRKAGTPAGAGGAGAPAAVVGGGGGGISGDPARTLLIRNMFDPAEETDENWDQDIKEDTEGECSKYGQVLHCYVEAKKPGGLVFLAFSTVEGAAAAAANLNGRFFAGRTVTAEYLPAATYAAATGFQSI